MKYNNNNISITALIFLSFMLRIAHGTAALAVTEKADTPLRDDHINILIVDDQEVNRKLLSQAIVKCAKEKHPSKIIVIFTANDGVAALPMFSSKKINVAFIDGEMPLMTGPELLKQLVTIKGYTGISVAWSSKPDLQAHMIKEGAKFQLPKPVTYPDLSDVLSKILDGKS